LRQDKLKEAVKLARTLRRDGIVAGEGAILEAAFHTKKGDLAATRLCLERACAKYPEDAPILEARCRFLFEHGDPAEQEQALQAHLRVDPKNGSAYHNLGMVYKKMNRNAEAVEAYEESLRHRPGVAITYLCLGYALLDCGNPKKARD